MRVCLHDSVKIEAFLRRDPGLYLYLLGDLDAFFWPHTTWYGWQNQEGELDALCLLYSGDELPVLLALAQPENQSLALLLNSLRALLPRRFYLHLSPGFESVLQSDWLLTGGEPHHRMLLTDTEQLQDWECSEAVELGAADLTALKRLYQQAYPHNWFNPRMLATGQYLGIWDTQHTHLLAVAGVHVYAPELGVAALGNITVDPDARGQGLSSRLTAALCRRLLVTTPVIGLNVHTANTPALRSYRRLGFEVCADYREWMAETIRP